MGDVGTFVTLLDNIFQIFIVVRDFFSAFSTTASIYPTDLSILITPDLFLISRRELEGKSESVILVHSGCSAANKVSNP